MQHILQVFFVKSVFISGVITNCEIADSQPFQSVPIAKEDAGLSLAATPSPMLYIVLSLDTTIKATAG